MASSNLLSWWYSPDTKLGIYFNNFGLDAATNTLTTAVYSGIDSTNGMGASIQEDYHFENIITSHPVEANNSISDHIIQQPLIISIQGILTSIAGISLVGGLDFSQLGNATQVLASMAQGPYSNGGISLVTGLIFGSSSYSRFDNLAVQSLDIPRNNDYGRASIKFTIVLKQLLITTTNGTVTTAGFSQGLPAPGAGLP